MTENPQPRTLQKWWKFCTISKCAKKIFFGKILCSTHQKKCFYKFLRLLKLAENPQFGENGKLNFCSTHQKKWKIHSRGPYKNGENFVLSQNVLRKYFLAKFFVPLIKRSVSTNFKAVFGKLNFWRKIHSCGALQKWWKFCTISKCAKKIFFCKILCSTHQKKCFYKLLGCF